MAVLQVCTQSTRYSPKVQGRVNRRAVPAAIISAVVEINLNPTMARKLPNYIRMHRKRSGLTQMEIAFVLGQESSTEVSRYERRSRKPKLPEAFALALLFGTTVEELFAGLYEDAKNRTIARLRLLQDEIKLSGCGKRGRGAKEEAVQIALQRLSGRHKTDSAT
jgi:transcriptional regulator with XRE-family HTH domain